MTLHWRIFFSAAALAIGLSETLGGAVVNGSVELRDSHDPAVRARKNFSGVVVSLTPKNGGTPEPLQIVRATIRQKNKEFSPHVLAIPVGSSVAFPNLDPIFHNAFSSYNGQIFDVGLYPPGTSRSVRFARAGVVRVFCNIHSSMSAMIAVLPTPYFAVSNRDGSFTLPDVPAGDYTLRVIHERSSEATLEALTHNITVGGAVMTLPLLSISEAGYLSIPHKNKYGRDYGPDVSDQFMYPATRK
jgi:plastocyanin